MGLLPLGFPTINRNGRSQRRDHPGFSPGSLFIYPKAFNASGPALGLLTSKRATNKTFTTHSTPLQQKNKKKSLQSCRTTRLAPPTVGGVIRWHSPALPTSYPPTAGHASGIIAPSSGRECKREGCFVLTHPSSGPRPACRNRTV